MTPYFRRVGATVALALAAAFVTTGQAAVSTQLSLTGVARPAVLDGPALRTFAPDTRTETFVAGTRQQTHTYTGAGLWTC